LKRIPNFADDKGLSTPENPTLTSGCVYPTLLGLLVTSTKLQIDVVSANLFVTK
jgi:hypothetical protein